LSAFVCIILLTFLACTRTTPSRDVISNEDRVAIAAQIERFNNEARRAWDLRDASIMIPDTTQEGAAAMRADIQRRMDMTTRVDTMIEVLDTLRVIGQDSVLAYSKQRFVRVIRLPEGEEKQRISTITHVRTFVHSQNGWEPVGPLLEQNPRAWWAGEPR
jgi:hypothetical protein